MSSAILNPTPNRRAANEVPAGPRRPEEAKLPKRSLGLGWPLALLVMAVTLFLRAYNVDQAYELFIDEITYARIADGVASKGAVELYGSPFFLHPPLYFILQAGVLQLLSTGGDIFDLVLVLRLFNIAFAVGSAVLILRMVTRVVGTPWGLLAAGLFALNPFLVRFDSRVLLETSTIFFVLLGYTLLLQLTDIKAEADDSPPDRRRLRAAAVGLVFSAALLSKETSAPLYVLPLLWCVVWSRPVPRRLAGTALGTLALGYLVYPLASILSGQGTEYVDGKFGGLLRMIGLRQETGFNAEGAPSFVSRLLANLDVFALTYVLIGLGLLAVLWSARRATGPTALLVLWCVSAFCLLGYQVTLGSLEEQMFYYLVIPSLIVACAAGARLIAVAGSRGLQRGAYAALGLAVLTAVAFDGQAWFKTHTRADDGYRQTISWMGTHAPEGARVMALAETSEFLLDGYDVRVENSPTAIVDRRAHYVITSSTQVEQGYGRADPALMRWLASNARPAFRARTNTSGDLTVWRTWIPLPANDPPNAGL